MRRAFEHPSLAPVTFQDAGSANGAWVNELPDPDVLLAQTNWAGLDHARGSAIDMPAGLTLFLDESITVRSEAAYTYLELVNHQNSIYSATTPVALYVAAILADERAAASALYGSRGHLLPMRVVLMNWLAGIAHDAGDEVIAISRNYGFDEYPAMTTLRAARPTLYRAVATFLRDSDSAVRYAAVNASIRLLDTPEQCSRRRDELLPAVHGLLRAGDEDGAYRNRALAILDYLGEDTRGLRADESSESDIRTVSYFRDRAQWRGGPPIYRVFRSVIADHFPNISEMPQAALLFGTGIDPAWDDRGFLSDFYNGILHQDTCGPATADGVPLLAAIAVDDRVPARHRFDAVDLLFDIATVSDRHQAECWPQQPPHADPVSEEAARSAVHKHVSELLARWGGECPAVRLVFAGLAVVFPNDRTLAALTPRLRDFADQHAAGTDIGDYVRFVLVLAADDSDATLAAVEELTDAYWRGTARTAPLRGRALHLLRQMLAKVRTSLMS